ncbi:ABC transporter permease [Mechercharimyces sp. CAU 1602]|uniref:ABC transporter permease n=1 Tax=Mechercharimyces sp. CAU 1602 TaxID=2973933 RepID=UPI0021612AE3|nr:ABC transporter permease subunit [Mechercharimyces sp. CAU 1602]MCS1350676.1 ABC transporter permease subunit [Mechercharimyces sp. CAU 1602]
MNLLHSEWQRIWGRRKTKVSLTLFFVLILFEGWFLLKVGGTSFYHPDAAVSLNSLNAAPFFLRELALYLNLIFIPMLVVDSVNGEYTSGAMRLILIRPIDKWKWVFAKWSVHAILLATLTSLMMSAGIIYGHLFMPKVEMTSFYQTPLLNPLESYIYIAKFYSIAFLTFLTVLSLSTFISTLMPNPILAYTGIIATYIFGLYAFDRMIIVLSTSDTIFNEISNSSIPSLLFFTGGCVILSFAFSLFIWNRRSNTI